MIKLIKTTTETITDKTTTYQKIIKLQLFKITLFKIISNGSLTEDITDNKIGYKTT